MKHILAYLHAPWPIESHQATECSEASFGSDSALRSISRQYVERMPSSRLFAHFSQIFLPEYATQCQYMLHGVVFPLKIRYALLGPMLELSLVDRHPLCTHRRFRIVLVEQRCMDHAIKSLTDGPAAFEQRCRARRPPPSTSDLWATTTRIPTLDRNTRDVNPDD